MERVEEMGPPGEDACQCIPLFRAMTELTASMEAVGLHPEGIISPICPEIFSSSFTSSWICQYETEMLLCFHLAPSSAAMKLFYCLLFAVHTNLSPPINTTHRESFYCISNKLTCYYTAWYYRSRRGSQEYVFVFLFFCVCDCFLASCVCLFHGNIVPCEDTWKPVRIFYLYGL